jgi:cytokinin dehydrogenase
VQRALAILPPFLGDGHRVLMLAKSDHPAAMALPERGPSVIFGIFPVGVPDALRETALNALQRVNELVLGAGGKRYLSGWLFDMNTQAWQAHYGNAYARVVEAQRACDPDGIFRSMLAQLDQH